MTNSSRRVRNGFSVLLLLLPGLSWAQNRPPIVEQMAKEYGIDSWGQIEGIRYTWNAEIFGLNLSHQWEWHPKTDTVTFEGKDKDGKTMKVTYQRSQLSSQDEAVKSQIDPAFINDQYWLIFPFHVIWDGGSTITDEGMQKLPIGTGSARRVVVKYAPAVGGYTPGDTWTLYVGNDNRVQQMIYHRGGPKKPSVVIVKWIDHKRAGPLLFAMDHRGTADEKPLRIWFSGISVKVTGSDNWMDAQ